MLFMMGVLGLSTIALQRALKSALNKDTQAMRALNQNRQRKSYQQVSSSDNDALEDAYESRQVGSSGGGQRQAS